MQDSKVVLISPKPADAQPTQSVNLGSIAKYLTTLAPVIVTSFLVLSSAFNHDAKGIVWLVLVGIGLLLVWGIQKLVGSTTDPERAKRCQQLFGLSLSSPSATSFFLAFTLFYFLFPMTETNDYNISGLAVLIILYAMDAVFHYMNRCSSDDWRWSIASIASASVLGAIWALWYFVFKSIGLGKLVYFGGKASNGEYCSKPKQQTFKCNVYKNGEVISTI